MSLGGVRDTLSTYDGDGYDNLDVYDASRGCGVGRGHVSGFGAAVREEMTCYPTRDTLEVMSNSTAVATGQAPAVVSVSLLRQAGRFIFRTLLTSVLSYGAGAVIGGLGDALRAMGAVRTGMSARALIGAGRVLGYVGALAQRGGRAVFLAVTVPAYMVFYQFPRWLFTEQLPLLARTLRDWAVMLGEAVTKFVRVIGQKMAIIANIAFDVLVDAAKVIKRLIRPVVDILSQGWQIAKKIAEQAANTIFDVIRRVGRQVALALQSVAEKIHSVVVSIAEGLRWVGRQLVQPVWNMMANQLQAIADRVTNVMHWAERFLRPLGRWVFNGMLWVARAVTAAAEKTWRALYAWLVDAGEIFSWGSRQVVRWVYARWLTVSTMVTRAAKAVVSWLRPVARFFGGNIRALGAMVASLARQGWGGVVAGCRAVAQRVMAVINMAARVLGWIEQRFAPLYQAINGAAKWVGQQLVSLVRITGSVLAEAAFRAKAAIAAGFTRMFRSLKRSSQGIVSASARFGIFISESVRALYDEVIYFAGELRRFFRSFVGQRS